MLPLPPSSSHSSNNCSWLMRVRLYSQNYFNHALKSILLNLLLIILISMGGTHSTQVLLVLWTLITILIITGSETFPKWDFKGETFKLCGENHQQHGLMSRLYQAKLTFASLSIGYEESRDPWLLLKIPVSSSCWNVSLSVADGISTLYQYNTTAAVEIQQKL